jgi:enoyl-CoA hydratase/carnithine racemase
MVLSGRRIEGIRAAEIGLVHQLASSREALVRIVAELASELVDAAPLSLAAAKAIVDLMHGRQPENVLNPEVFKATQLRAKLATSK